MALTVVRDPPPGYLRVRSALGEGAPRALVLAPLIRGERTVGLLELAFFKPWTDPMASLLAAVSETMAVALATALSALVGAFGCLRLARRFSLSTPAALWLMIGLLFNGTVARIQGCTISRVREATIECDEPMTFHVDGEPHLGGTSLRARVHPGALRVAV